jgi:hypothetical protein
MPLSISEVEGDWAKVKKTDTYPEGWPKGDNWICWRNDNTLLISMVEETYD